jgi:hypothetical protein
MNNRFESQDKLLIISPSEQDFSELKIKFEEKNVELAYLAQVRGAEDDNSYETYIFYYKGDKSFTFYEYDNPQNGSYHSKTNECSLKEYWEKLCKHESYGKELFFKYSEADFNYKELDSILTVNTEVKPRKVKM